MNGSGRDYVNLDSQTRRWRSGRRPIKLLQQDFEGDRQQWIALEDTGTVDGERLLGETISRLRRDGLCGGERLVDQDQWQEVSSRTH